MAENIESQFQELQEQLLDKIVNQDKEGFKQLIAQVNQLNPGVNETMAENSESQLDEVQKQIFDKLANNVDGFKQLIAQVKGGVNFLHENGMPPLQYACCNGNKDAVQILLDMGANVFNSEQIQNYSTLHCAALYGNTDICCMLLDAGINPDILNYVGYTASQMAKYAGSHACVGPINNCPSKYVNIGCCFW